VRHQTHREHLIFDGRGPYRLKEWEAVTITKITGTLKGAEHVFVEKTDFALDANANSVIWTAGGETPDKNTKFSVEYLHRPYRADEMTYSIVERLPAFYQAREPSSFFHRIVHGLAKVMSDQEQQLSKISNSHYVDTATDKDLENLAAVIGARRNHGEGDADFRNRLRSILVEFRDRGTVVSIRAQLASLLGTSIDEIEIIENPLEDRILETKVRSRDMFEVDSRSIFDEKATISISSPGGEASNPALVDESNGVIIRFNGILKKGDTLEISQGQARLNGRDITNLIQLEHGTSTFSPGELPKVSRIVSRWRFKEKFSDSIARFDEARFDENIFSKDIPPTIVRFNWTARLAAAFEVRIPQGVLESNSGISKKDIQNFLDTIKAAGVRALVTIMPKQEQVELPKLIAEKSRSAAKKGTEGRGQRS